MAESLCNNPKARVTSRGLSPSKPCGLFEKYGVGWCSKKDYNDWLALYDRTINAAEGQFLYLQKFKTIKGLGKALDPEEIVAQEEIEIAKLHLNTLQEQSMSEPSQKSAIYEKRIAELDTRIANLDCMIENNIQAKLDILGAPPKPTGLIEGSRESNVGKYFVWGLVGIGAVWVVKNL